jgi:2-amino-4-hydroxy-6-hydroxymethyldihydropteridine diphosphokinase
MSDRSSNRAYLSLGSNIEPERNLPAALRECSKMGSLLAVSRAWESPPFGSDLPAANFLNAALCLDTDLSATALCTDAIPAIEERLGRVRDPRDKNAPRTIDVDLSLFGDEMLTVGHRTIPDPAILTRAFVAVPLAEVNPDYVHPVVLRRLAAIAADLAANQRLWLRPDVVLGLRSSALESSR